MALPDFSLSALGLTADQHMFKHSRMNCISKLVRFRKAARDTTTLGPRFNAVLIYGTLSKSEGGCLAGWLFSLQLYYLNLGT